MVVNVVTGVLGNSGRTMPVRIRNSPAVMISCIATRRASACSFSRPVSNSTAVTVVATATHGGRRQRNGAEKISVNIEHRHDQLDIGFRGVVLVPYTLAVKNREPGAEHDETGGEGDEVDRVEDVKHPAGSGEHRKSAYAARTLRLGVGKEILECQSEKQAQAEKQGNAGQGRC